MNRLTRLAGLLAALLLALPAGAQPGESGPGITIHGGGKLQRKTVLQLGAITCDADTNTGRMYTVTNPASATTCTSAGAGTAHPCICQGADGWVALPGTGGGGGGTPDDNSVTSAKIANGAIVNEDVNASAAIAGTKIQAAAASTAGAVTAGSQSFSGAKTFLDGLIMGALSNLTIPSLAGLLAESGSLITVNGDFNAINSTSFRVRYGANPSQVSDGGLALSTTGPSGKVLDTPAVKLRSGSAGYWIPSIPESLIPNDAAGSWLIFCDDADDACKVEVLPVPASWLPAATTSAQGAVELATDGESAANVAVQGNDARLSNARAPTSHASSHQHGGGDQIATATPGANAIPKAGGSNTLDPGWLPAATTSAQGAAELATSGEAAANVAVQGNDARLVDLWSADCAAEVAVAAGQICRESDSGSSVAREVYRATAAGTGNWVLVGGASDDGAAEDAGKAALYGAGGELFAQAFVTSPKPDGQRSIKLPHNTSTIDDPPANETSLGMVGPVLHAREDGDAASRAYYPPCAPSIYPPTVLSELPPGQVTTTSIASAGQMRCADFRMTCTARGLDTIAVQVTTGQTSAVAGVAVYSAGGSTRLAQTAAAGETATAAVVATEAVTPVTLHGGEVYRVCGSASHASVALRSFSGQQGADNGQFLTELTADGVIAMGVAANVAEYNAACTASTTPYACCTGSGTGTCTGFPSTTGAMTQSNLNAPAVGLSQ